MSAQWTHLEQTDVYTLEGDGWFARISPHSTRPDGQVAFWILELKNNLHQTKKHAHFTSVDDAKKEAEAALLGQGQPQKLYALNL